MSTLKSSDDHLTLNADGSGKAIKFQADGVEKASINSSGLLTSTTIDATALTGNLPAIDGSNLTGISAGTALTGSTNNTIPTVTGANAISGEANLTFDGTDLTLGTGDLIFGTANRGICLGVTTNTDSNPLDDYEEGTFTFAMYSGETGTVTNTTATYTKIGRNVTVNFYGTIAGAQNNANVRLSGLPFSMNQTGLAITAFASNQQSVGLWMSNLGYCYYQNTTVGGNNQGENANWLDASTGITFQATYMV